MKIAKSKLKQIIKEELRALNESTWSRRQGPTDPEGYNVEQEWEQEQKLSTYPLKNVPQDYVTSGEEGEQAVMQGKRAPNEQEEASQLFGDRVNIDISKHAYRMGQHLGPEFAPRVAKALSKVVPHAGAKMLLGAQHGFEEDPSSQSSSWLDAPPTMPPPQKPFRVTDAGETPTLQEQIKKILSEA